MAVLLDVRDLQTWFPGPRGGPPVRAVDGVSFTVGERETVALVGESGCGKSLTALSIMRLVPKPGHHPGGEILYRGKDILGMGYPERRALRGARIAMIFQEPHTSLNPVVRVGDQVAEAIRSHRRVPKAEALAEAARLFAEVGMSEPERRVRDYPHQLSGGMKQRVMIAISLACGPELLIADEPTTALDVTIQAQILSLIRRLREARGMSMILITHDLGIVRENADRICIMYAGQVVEAGPAAAIFGRPGHPYTRALFRSRPSRVARGSRLPEIPGTVPLPAAFPAGCRFHPRCPEALARCRTEPPAVYRLGDGHAAACHLHDGTAPREASP